MDYFQYTLIAFFICEVIVAFILYPLKSGKNYYKLMLGTETSMFKYDQELGYSLKPNLNYSNPTTPVKNAPRRILFRDMRTDKNGFGFNEDLDECKNKSKLIFCLGGSTTWGGGGIPTRSYIPQHPKLTDERLWIQMRKCRSRWIQINT